MDGLSSALCSGVSGHLCLSIKSHSSGMNIHGCSTQKAEQTWSETTFMFHREYHESRVGSYAGQSPSAPCLLVLHLYNYLTLATVASMICLLWIQVGHHCHLGPLHGKEQCCSHTSTNCLCGISLPQLLLGQRRVVLPPPPLPESTGLP